MMHPDQGTLLPQDKLYLKDLGDPAGQEKRKILGQRRKQGTLQKAPKTCMSGPARVVGVKEWCQVVLEPELKLLVQTNAVVADALKQRGELELGLRLGGLGMADFRRRAIKVEQICAKTLLPRLLSTAHQGFHWLVPMAFMFGVSAIAKSILHVDKHRICTCVITCVLTVTQCL
jgi:hypothetical protein